MADSANEIVVRRTISAPLALVWKAWTEPARIAQWWGPHGFTTTTSTFEFIAGGVWRFVMHGPDGTDYHNKITYIDIDEPNRLVYKHDGEEETVDVKFETTVSFKEHDDKTEVTLCMKFASTAERDEVAEKYGAVEGGEQTLERLAMHVEKNQGHAESIHRPPSQ